MSYYDTMDEDLKRAREMLERGKAKSDELIAEVFPQPEVRERVMAIGGAIYGADTFAAYKLIESFVKEIEELQAVVRFLKADVEGRAEICVCAALRLPDRRVFRGHRHDNAIRTAGNAGASRQDIADAIQGFVTTRNRFVDRKEAMALQRAAGYGSAYSPDGELHGDALFSEDLYGNGIDTLIVTKG